MQNFIDVAGMLGGRTIQFNSQRILTILNDFGTMTSDLSEEKDIKTPNRLPAAVSSSPSVYCAENFLSRFPRIRPLSGRRNRLRSVYRVTSMTSANITRFCVNYTNYAIVEYIIMLVTI